MKKYFCAALLIVSVVAIKSFADWNDLYNIESTSVTFGNSANITLAQPGINKRHCIHTMSASGENHFMFSIIDGDLVGGTTIYQISAATGSVAHIYFGPESNVCAQTNSTMTITGSRAEGATGTVKFRINTMSMIKGR